MKQTPFQQQRRLAKILDAGELHALHDLLTIYNGMVIVLIAGFMSITQQKIIQTMNAHAFLAQLPSLPLPPAAILFDTIGAFLLLALLGRIYREAALPPLPRYLCLAAEIILCVVIMRSLSLAYDGIVLLVVADLLHRYSGRHQLILLSAAMLGLYAIVDYNIASFTNHLSPFDAYTAYYAAEPRAWIIAIHHGLTSVNLVLFVFYLTLLVRQNHQEKQRSRASTPSLKRRTRACAPTPSRRSPSRRRGSATAWRARSTTRSATHSRALPRASTPRPSSWTSHPHAPRSSSPRSRTSPCAASKTCAAASRNCARTTSSNCRFDRPSNA